MVLCKEVFNLKPIFVRYITYIFHAYICRYRYFMYIPSITCLSNSLFPAFKKLHWGNPTNIKTHYIVIHHCVYYHALVFYFSHGWNERREASTGTIWLCRRRIVVLSTEFAEFYLCALFIGSWTMEWRREKGGIEYFWSTCNRHLLFCLLLSLLLEWDHPCAFGGSCNYSSYFLSAEISMCHIKCQTCIPSWSQRLTEWLKTSLEFFIMELQEKISNT